MLATNKCARDVAVELRTPAWMQIADLRGPQGTPVGRLTHVENKSTYRMRRGCWAEHGLDQVCHDRDMTSPAEMQPSPLIVQVGFGMYPVAGALRFRTSVADAEQLAGEMKTAGLDIGPVPMMSAEPVQLATFAVLTGGTLTGLAAVLRSYFSRHQHRAVLIDKDGTKIHLQGLSQHEMESVIERTLTAAMEAQHESDALWDRVMDEPQKPSL